MHNENNYNQHTTTAEPVFTHSDFQTREKTNNHQKGSSSRFRTGLVVGGLVGAAAALLYAPKKGNEFRNDLRDTSIKLKERTMQKKDETMLKAKLGTMDAKDAVDNMKDKSSSMSVSARQKLQEAKNTIKDAKKETKSAIDEAKVEAEKDGYSTQSSTNTTAVVKPRTMTGTDSSSYEKKQSDVNKF
ncbi:YtxH domain-containing protein [Fictibacillus phosphorivorans]|uniref:YtxH domain-containing protein n=1 Tax=Fictibacillus phosphorivorans TaxID=1221500 RepID=UPI00203DA2C3|nr:YtxH domain-containing protein [Fictibacillus phosphorivorans]MCM3718566.1 YtxH domain-containing protein [Fictibacillus phosphorivorans]MCM3776189.1 YtxH domain-containing protein [Fictibacillus phosphorivorans]